MVYLANILFFFFFKRETVGRMEGQRWGDRENLKQAPNPA